MKPQTKNTNSPTLDRNADGHSDSVQIRKPSLSEIAVMVLGCLGLAAGITMLDHHLKTLKNELIRCELRYDDIDAPPCLSDMSTCDFGEGTNGGFGVASRHSIPLQNPLSQKEVLSILLGIG